MNRWWKWGIGIIVAIVAVVALVSWAQTRMRSFFYPVAPPMPPVVGETMPEILARLEAVLTTNAPQVLAGLQSGLSPDAIAKLEQQYQVRLPEDIKAIYAWHDGSVNSSNRLSNDFIPTHRFPSPELDEDFERAEKVWGEYGASNLP